MSFWALDKYSDGSVVIHHGLCMGGSKSKVVCPWHVAQRQSGSMVDGEKDGVKAVVEDREPKAMDDLKEKMMTTLKVKGMSCQHCVMSVTKALSQLEGIENVQVDLTNGEVRFENTKSVASDQIEKAIVEAGYEVVLTQ